MTVGELIKELKTLDKKLDVILPSDPEGNSYNELYCVSIGNSGVFLEPGRDVTDMVCNKENEENE